MPIVPSFARLRSPDFPVRAPRRSGKRFPTTIIGTCAGRHRHSPVVIRGRLGVMPGGTIAPVRTRRHARAPACQVFDSQPFHSKEDGAHGYV